MSTVNAQAIIDVADHLFTAIEQSDLGILNEVFDRDVAVWRSGASGDDDKEHALRVLAWFINRTTDRRYQIFDRQVFASDPADGFVGGFVQQHILHATRTSTGEALALRVCLVAKFGANYLISRIDEYFDPADLAPLLN
ncbi:DUF4440 domain-containing protein [Mycobacterium talmoniae]|uniref:DUF4440 domain-containing protein n=1 Tax=Mycobacterium talmoniae TaxID=1858794 RepID=A0A1S1MG88_9MYCO|nr:MULTISPECIES: DUF4440 domain-containing protein [Mycobacterium]OHU82250.1 DUF4440 domain-containing protein [Mycobacterium talmoniae]PQM46884.1 hypothetical protein C1Y40_02938 [Mycobacterium talmoniae]TDH54184.1 DUF4440 domain-containing protein [Mycobacterium eburneum]